jgi:cold-inducible RNA-binding protein
MPAGKIPGAPHAKIKVPFESPAKLAAIQVLPSGARTIERQKAINDTMKNIFVGNLDFSATESSIRALFEPYGAVDRVNVVTDRDTGRSRGFAFVEMSDSAQADQAIAALNGTNLDGRALNVNEARPKPQGGGGGFSRGGGSSRGGGGGHQRSRW